MSARSRVKVERSFELGIQFRLDTANVVTSCHVMFESVFLSLSLLSSRGAKPSRLNRDSYSVPVEVEASWLLPSLRPPVAPYEHLPDPV